MTVMSSKSTPAKKGGGDTIESNEKRTSMTVNVQAEEQSKQVKEFWACLTPPRKGLLQSTSEQGKGRRVRLGIE